MSTFFIGSNDNSPADVWLNPDLLMKAAPDYYGPRFEAIKELRERDDGSLYRGAGFKHIASLVNVPIAQALRMTLDPEWFKDRRKFYAWLDRNPEYLAYQRRKNQKRGDLVTFQDGKEIGQ